jgi:3-oxoacyl-[acyl-carrier-protein] synthase II
LNVLLSRVRETAGVTDPGIVVSAACASSTVALARAAGLVASGIRECVLVVAFDAVTEFIYSGFSSLMALDRGPARPFDKNRTGLSVGEAVAYALVMSGARAVRERRGIEGEIAGWGISCDANHMTGPSRDGVGQAAAIKQALARAFISPAEIGAMSAHGTGTVYNDSMEMKGFRSVFGDGPRPVYSVKGGIGHTMGAAGLVEALLAMRAMREGAIPPTVGLELVDPEAAGWVQREARTIGKGKIVLSTNSGFGGVNAALVMRPARSAA